MAAGQTWWREPQLNRPPTEIAARVRSEVLRSYIKTICLKVGMSDENAGLLAELLVQNDLRGVTSHGTQQLARYVPAFLAGELNPRPVLKEEQPAPALLIVEGDGGLGYFAAYRAARLLVDLAQQHGIAVALTRNHGHIGAAGLYSRIPAAHDLFCYGTSGHQLELTPGKPWLTAAGGSPMTFAVPAGEEHPIVLDFGTNQDLMPNSSNRDALIGIAPGLVFRNGGLGVMCQILGGILAGVPIDPARAARAFSGANQGALFIVIEISRFMPLETFRREIDEYIRRTRALTPLPGYTQSLLPGALEYQRERDYEREGIPFGVRTLHRIAEAGAAVGVAPPFPVP